MFPTPMTPTLSVVFGPTDKDDKSYIRGHVNMSEMKLQLRYNYKIRGK